MDKLDLFLTRYGSAGTEIILERAFELLAQAASELEKLSECSREKGRVLALADNCENIAKRLDHFKNELVNGIEERLKISSLEL